MYREYRTTIGVTLIAFVLILSTITAVFSAGADASLDAVKDNGDINSPPGFVNPGEGIGKPSGSFVSFDPIENGISNYSFNIDQDQQLRIFDKITVEEFGKYEESIKGQTYFSKGQAAEFQLFDNPSTMLKMDVHSLEESGRQVSFSLGDMEVSDEGDGDMVNIGGEGHSGNLISLDISDPDQSAPSETNDFTVENDNRISFTVEDKATIIFRMENEGLSDEISSFVREKMRNGEIGAEFRIESSKDDYNHMYFSYRDVDVKAQMKDENKLEMLVSSETLGDEGTLVLLDVSSAVMDVSSEEHIDMSFDGGTVSFMEDASEVSESDDPSYTLVNGEEGTHILVKVPSFSTHSITVENIRDVVNQYMGSLVYYGITSVVTGGLVIVGLLYREKDRKDRKVSIDRSSDENNIKGSKKKSQEKKEKSSRKD